MNIAEILLTRR